MIYEAIALAFKYKLVSNVIILACCNKYDAVQHVRSFQRYNILATVSCDPNILFRPTKHQLQGFLYLPDVTLSEKHFAGTEVQLAQVASELYSNWYKWILLTEDIPKSLNKKRYDADVLLAKSKNQSVEEVAFEEVYMHPHFGASAYPWAFWSSRSGFKVIYEKERTLRRLNLRKYPLRIATPLGLYSNETYDGSFLDYLKDMSMPERDSGVRCGYTVSSIIVEKLNATEVLIPTKLWSTEVSNSSMLLKLRYGEADLSGGVLRIMHSRFEKLDYAMTIWPFRVGFTYLAERESSNNMFVAPFTVDVWWCCLALLAVLLFAQRVTAKSPHEKEGAYMAVLATSLQQDASAVPNGISGRWTFLVLSICAMLIHAYYTSAIVSALMSTGRSGPDSLKSLGDSRYAIASEDYDYMRYLMFDVPTNWDDLEYLKRKKMTAKFYQDIRDGVKMIQGGQTAYHTEYNQLYPYFKTFTEDQLCKLQYIDTVPEILSWITTTKRGQWTDIFKSSGAWLHETGLAKQLVSKLRIKPPPCRAALLAEQVNIYDITPLLAITLLAVVISVIILGLEIVFAKWKARRIIIIE